MSGDTNIHESVRADALSQITDLLDANGAEIALAIADAGEAKFTFTVTVERIMKALDKGPDVYDVSTKFRLPREAVKDQRPE